MINRISNPIVAATLIKPLCRALEASSFDGDVDAAAHYLISNILNDRLGLFVARTAHEVVGMIVCVLPSTPLTTSPEILLQVNFSTDPKIGTDLAEAVVSFAKQVGYHTMVVCNRSGRSDKVFERHYRKPGRSLRVLGTMFEFTELDGDDLSDRPSQ